MHHRTRYRVQPIPMLLVFACAGVFVALLALPQLGRMLERHGELLPWLTIGITGSVVLTFLAWYAICYAEVERGMVRVSSLSRKQSANLKSLVAAEVRPRTAAKRRRGIRRRAAKQPAAGALMLRLQDGDGRIVWLPLDTWRDEDLLMARVLRATVDRRVAIDGEPNAVRRFTRLLESYKSWDRQQAA